MRLEKRNLAVLSFFVSLSSSFDLYLLQDLFILIFSNNPEFNLLQPKTEGDKFWMAVILGILVLERVLLFFQGNKKTFKKYHWP